MNKLKPFLKRSPNWVWGTTPVKENSRFTLLFVLFLNYYLFWSFLKDLFSVLFRNYDQAVQKSAVSPTAKMSWQHFLATNLCPFCICAYDYALYQTWNTWSSSRTTSSVDQLSWVMLTTFRTEPASSTKKRETRGREDIINQTRQKRLYKQRAVSIVFFCPLKIKFTLSMIKHTRPVSVRITQGNLLPSTGLKVNHQ